MSGYLAFLAPDFFLLTGRPAATVTDGLGLVEEARLAEGRAFIDTPDCDQRQTSGDYTSLIKKGSTGEKGVLPLQTFQTLQVSSPLDGFEQRDFIRILDVHSNRNPVGDPRDTHSKGLEQSGEIDRRGFALDGGIHG